MSVTTLSPEAPASREAPKVTDQLGKFVISTFAVGCAALLPRAISALATTGPNSSIELFSRDYLILAGLVAVAVGAAVVLIQWYQPCQPPRIFIATLAFPSLISGGLNMAVGVNELEAKAEETQQAYTELARQLDITVIETITPVQPANLDPSSAPAAGGADTSGLVRRALAQSTPQLLAQSSAQSFNPGRIVREPLYLVVLGQARTLEEAQQRLLEARPFVSEATVVEAAGQIFYIVASPRSVPLSQASTEAVRLKRRFAEAGYPDAGVTVLRVH